MNGQLGLSPGPSGPGRASYLTGCGKELAARYRSGESPSFEEGVLQKAGRLSVMKQIDKKITNLRKAGQEDQKTISDGGSSLVYPPLTQKEAILDSGFSSLIDRNP